MAFSIMGLKKTFNFFYILKYLHWEKTAMSFKNKLFLQKLIITRDTTV